MGEKIHRSYIFFTWCHWCQGKASNFQEVWKFVCQNKRILIILPEIVSERFWGSHWISGKKVSMLIANFVDGVLHIVPVLIIITNRTVLVKSWTTATMLTMMGSNKVCRTKSCSFGKPKTPRLGISGIDYVNGLANHGYNHFHKNGGGGSSKHDHLLHHPDNGPPPRSPHSPPPPPQQLLQSIEVVQHHHHQQQQILHHHLDAITKAKASTIDSSTISSSSAAAGFKLKRKKLQPFEPTYYFDSDFDSEDGGGGGRRRSSTLTCSPSIVSRFLRLSRRKSGTSSSSKSSKSKREGKDKKEDDQQPILPQEMSLMRDDLLLQVEKHTKNVYKKRENLLLLLMNLTFFLFILAVYCNCTAQASYIIIIIWCKIIWFLLPATKKTF